ncbi:patched domain-containing protein 3-like [Centruroides sculpturatus]|uniref:patched domain-containing protein 3-like n=2 Tax=Centruroides sculpturatus TaxID=218467 RepID=UPI000C6DE9D9|nr:patched domain-containing protein 3-like [Centruroides sculpturatus]
MKLICIQYGLSRYLLVLGRIIARHPLYFVFSPIIITALLSTGLFRMKSNRDVEYLFTALNGRADNNKKLVETLFPQNLSYHYDHHRLAQKSHFTMVQVIAKDGGHILHDKIINEIYLLDEIIRNITVYVDGKKEDYSTLCGKKFGKCVKSNAMKVLSNANDIKSGTYKIRYPYDIDDIRMTYDEYILSLGGVSLDENQYITGVKAVRLIYVLNKSNPQKREAILEWESMFNKVIESVDFETISVSYINDESIEEEMQRCTDRLLLRIPIVITIVSIFSFVTCLTNDWVKSKPWLGPAACLSAGLALASGAGFMSYVGIEYVDFNIALCYIILGTEIDDAFVLIAAWRVTNPKDSIEKRMGQTYSEAGVSITITSITNFVSFCIGMSAPFPAFQTFCMYGATWFFFTYAYQITFFGACLALSAYREKNYLHPLTFRPLKYNEENSDKKADIYREEYIMAKFRDVIGHLLTFPLVKVIVIIIFITNLGIGIMGLMMYSKSGNDYADVFRYNSSLVTFNSVMHKYFNKYAYPVHVIINEPLDYSDIEVQKKIEETLQKFEAHPNIADSSVRLSWLKYYKFFLNHPTRTILLRGFNISDKEDFVFVLRNIFLRLPQAQEFKSDIIFNENHTEIIASRFLLLLTNINDQNVEINVLRDLYNIVDNSPLKIHIHSIMFHMIEQALLITSILYQLAIVSAVLICLVFFIFVPNVTCALCTSMIILCIICETVGFVSFFHVKLDIVMLASLVVCVGFSINYPTHISYSFVTSNKLNPDERLKKSLYEIGLPIFQGSFSTILGVSVLPFEPFYSSVSFFKIVLVIGLQTAFHAMFVIPVFLTIIGNFNKSLTRKIDSTKSIGAFIPENDSHEESMSLTSEKDQAVTTKL